MRIMSVVIPLVAPQREYEKSESESKGAIADLASASSIVFLYGTSGLICKLFLGDEKRHSEPLTKPGVLLRAVCEFDRSPNAGLDAQMDLAGRGHGPDT